MERRFRLRRPICQTWQNEFQFPTVPVPNWTTSERGSLTVESSIGLLVFVCAMMSLMLLIQHVGFSEAVHQSLYETAQEVSAVDVRSEPECLALSSMLFYAKLEPQQVLSKKLFLSKVELSPAGVVTLTASWKTILPMGGRFDQTYSLKTRLLTRGDSDTVNDETQRVYVTETGSKYHVLGCNHLRSSSIPLLRKEAMESGYTPCWHCIGGLKPFEPAPGKLEE